MANKGTDLYVAYRFVKELSTPFDKTDAFSLGLIDAKGKLLKRPKTQAEKKAYNPFVRLIFNVKRALGRAGLGNRLSSFAAAMFLMKEESSDDQRLNFLCDNEYVLNSSMLRCRAELGRLRPDLVILEDAPTNAVGGGAIAGTDDNPPVRKKQKSYSFIRRINNSDVYMVDKNTFAAAKVGRRKGYAMEEISDEFAETLKEHQVNDVGRPLIIQCDETNELLFVAYGHRKPRGI